MCHVCPQLVADEGGFDIVCQDRRWTKIAVQMGFAPGKAVGSHLRGHYEKILYPYNLFQSGANLLVSSTDIKQLVFFLDTCVVCVQPSFSCLCLCLIWFD